MRERMREDQCSLALPQVTTDLLAVPTQVTRQVQHVVLDLERRPEEEPESVEAIEVVDGPAANAPILIGWTKLYQAVFFSTSSR